GPARTGPHGDTCSRLLYQSPMATPIGFAYRSQFFLAPSLNRPPIALTDSNENGSGRQSVSVQHTSSREAQRVGAVRRFQTAGTHLFFRLDFDFPARIGDFVLDTGKLRSQRI